MRPMPILPAALLVIAATAADFALAQQQADRPIGRTQEQQAHERSNERRFFDLDERDRVIAEIWGLNAEEMQRAKLLLQGPRAAFSVANLSPVEALGIHARSEAERRKYAELFARAFHQDVERSLAWSSAYQEAIARLYPNEPVVDYSGQPKVAAPIGAADVLNVPRLQLIETPAPAPSSRVPAADRR